MPEIHDHRAPRLLPCPSCEQRDQVRNVAAVHLEGRREVTVPDGEGGTTTRARQSALSAALAPVPAAPPNGWSALAVLGLVLGAVLYVVGLRVGDMDPASPGFRQAELLHTIGTALLGVGTAAVVLAVRQRRRYRRETAGREAAETLWAPGWYCGRCAVVYLTPRPGEPVRGLTLAGFRAAVWSAGGYGHLADRHPVP